MKLEDLRALLSNAPTVEPKPPALELKCERCSGALTTFGHGDIWVSTCDRCVAETHCARCKREVSNPLELETLADGRRMCPKCRILDSIDMMKSFMVSVAPGMKVSVTGLPRRSKMNSKRQKST